MASNHIPVLSSLLGEGQFWLDLKYYDHETIRQVAESQDFDGLLRWLRFYLRDDALARTDFCLDKMLSGLREIRKLPEDINIPRSEENLKFLKRSLVFIQIVSTGFDATYWQYLAKKCDSGWELSPGLKQEAESSDDEPDGGAPVTQHYAAGGNAMSFGLKRKAEEDSDNDIATKRQKPNLHHDSLQQQITTNGKSMSSGFKRKAEEDGNGDVAAKRPKRNLRGDSGPARFARNLSQNPKFREQAQFLQYFDQTMKALGEY